MDAKIENNIPIPFGRRTSQYGPIARQMKIGDSVKVPSQEARNSLYSYLRALACKPVTRKLKDGTYRVWRTV